jgi:peroxiredoxin
VDNAMAELQALLAMSEGKTPEEVQKLLDAAKDTPKERQVRYQLKLGKMDKAATLANQLPDDAPGLALRVDALLQCGKTDDAKKQFEKARTTAALLDPGLPMSHRLDAIAVQLGVGATWRKPEPAHADSGVRPELDSLGPIHWHPWKAAEFTLPDARGKEMSLKDFSGKPVVVLFYLGSTCSHCMEQLKAFTSTAKEFEAAGIKIVAIGSEGAMGLTATSNTCDVKSGAPFPLLSDPELKIFKQWRCHDDFEKSPLHGAFLVDGKGQVRWADISYEPLRDAKFLLGEAKRLLKFE